MSEEAVSKLHANLWTLGAGVLLGTILTLGVSIGKNALLSPFRHQKHTGHVTMLGKSGSYCQWFLNPKQEIFEYCFDNRLELVGGFELDDLVYTDDSSWEKHIVYLKPAQPKVSH